MTRCLLGSIAFLVGALSAAGCFDDSKSKHPCDACLECEECIEGSGEVVQCAAVSHEYQQCAGGDVHWFDSCDVDEGFADVCPDNAACVDLSASDAECACTNHWQGDDCEVCPDNWDADQDCAACANNWTGEDCDDCPGNWDESTDCAECENQWVDNGDDCGTCPGNWDPAQNCNECVGHWDAAFDCEACENAWLDEDNDCGTCPGNWDATADCGQCVGNWDEAADCASCTNQWLDEGNDCGTCPGNWDPDQDCAACLGNWDATSDCTECENAWIDDGDDCGTCPSGWGGAECDSCVRYVDIGVVFPGDCGTWASACETVQQGIDEAYAAVQTDSAIDECEVWVAQGIYYTYSTSAEDSVDMASNVHLYGGFAGDETDLSERDIEANETILDGRNSAFGDQHVYHVVVGDNNSTIDGFTVREGYANAAHPDNNGAGIIIDGVNTTVLNCMFTDNVAITAGAGLYVDSGTPLVQNCRFFDNYAYDYGGGAASFQSSCEISNCVFADNIAGEYGGGVRVRMGDAVLTNLTFHGNSAPEYHGGALYSWECDMTLRNSILWGDEGGEIAYDWPMPEFSHNDIQDFAFAEDFDPEFVDPGGGDFRLQSGSQAIDAAHGSYAPDFDIDGNPRVDDPDSPNTGDGPPWADMGAYEYQP